MKRTVYFNPMKIMTMLMVGFFATSCSKSQSAQQAVTPGKKLNLSGFTLQLPLAAGSSIQQVSGNALANFSSSNFYYDAKSGATAMYCSSDGFTTPDSHYPRTELRDNTNWYFQGTHTLHAEVAVTQQPNSGNIIIGQIHGDRKGTEAVKIRWTNGEIQAGIKEDVDGTETRYTLIKHVDLGQLIDYTITQKDLSIQITANGQSVTVALQPSWNNEQVYFKTGNYLQDNATPVSSGTVLLYSIDTNTH